MTEIYENVDQKVVLIVVDGFGIGEDEEGNAINHAEMPNWNNLKKTYSYCELDASGNSVGLPNGVMGNSEVGHLTIGTGRITYQSLELINRACDADNLQNHILIDKLISNARENNSNLHLMGLVSDGGVHSHQEHLYYLLKTFHKKASDLNIYIHAFTDGRDTPPDSAVNYIDHLLEVIKNYSNIRLASIIGRYYVMDRDKKWDRIKIAFDLLTKGEGEYTESPIEKINQRYEKKETDEFLKPILIDQNGIIKNLDSVLFFNFRPDRARQISMALNNLHKLEENFIENLFFVTMTSYDDEWNFPVLFETPNLKDCLSELVSKAGYHQTHIAETEKYAHVTYFLNGGQESPFDNEKRILIPSLKIPTYDLQPQMSTNEIVSATIKEIESKNSSFIVLNIASPDMVGHTGNLRATINALENFDQQLGLLHSSCLENNFCLIITADHGNCEYMLDNGKIHTAHTTNKVPFLVTQHVKLRNSGGLSDIAPTVLDLMGIEKSELMTGRSLIHF